MFRGLIPYLAYAYVRFVGLTSRINLRGEEHRKELRRQGRHFIYALWHQRAPFFAYTHSHDNTSVLVSRSQDGEIIAQLLRLSGIGACRGSSTRGGAAATREMLELVEAGQDIGVTLDGPKGPARKVKPGVLFLAQKLGIPILPLTCAFRRRVEFKRSWDRFLLPLPFNNAVVRYGAPILVGPQDDIEAKAAEVEESLNAITDQADSEA